MNKGEEDRKDKNVRNGRKTGLALEKIPIIGLILLILLSLFLAILNYILDLHFTLPDCWLINHYTAPGIIKMRFYSFMPLYTFPQYFFLLERPTLLPRLNQIITCETFPSNLPDSKVYKIAGCIMFP